MRRSALEDVLPLLMLRQHTPKSARLRDVSPELRLHTRTSASLLAADSADVQGTSFNDGTYALYLNVTDQNIQPDEGANPVVTLRQRYDAWKAGRSRTPDRSM